MSLRDAKILKKDKTYYAVMREFIEFAIGMTTVRVEDLHGDTKTKRIFNLLSEVLAIIDE